MKHLLAFSISFLFIASASAQKDKIYIKDTFIQHYMVDGKLASPFQSTGKYHKKTKRKKGEWIEYDVVRDFEYRLSPKKGEPEQVFGNYIEKAVGSYKDGKRQGEWKCYLIEFGNQQERLYKKLNYSDGIKQGPFTYYFADGKVGITGNHSVDKYNGPVQSFYHNGAKYGLRIYQAGKATGKHVYYYPNGNTRMILYYLNDKRHGEQKTWYPDGTLKEEYTNNNGKTNGIYRFYHSNGKLWVEKHYEADKLLNVSQCMDATGKALDKGTIKDGNGTVKFYNKSGKVYAIKTYQNGIKVKEERF